jgi:hypothetical protein
LEGFLNERKKKIIEYSTKKNWFSLLPNKDWLCVLVVNDKPRRYVDEVISKILAKDVGYVSTIGKQCEQVHDMFDEEVAYREAEIENLYLPDHYILTT